MARSKRLAPGERADAIVRQLGHRLANEGRNTAGISKPARQAAMYLAAAVMQAEVKFTLAMHGYINAELIEKKKKPLSRMIDTIPEIWWRTGFSSHDQAKVFEKIKSCSAAGKGEMVLFKPAQEHSLSLTSDQ